MGFTGVVISDYTAIKELKTHEVAEDDFDSCVKQMKATVDIDMMSNVYVNNIKEALEKTTTN